MALFIILLITDLLLAQAPSIFSDVKAFQIGDVVTILIVESANAIRQSKIQSQGTSSLNVDGSVKGTLTNYLPLFGMSSATNSSHDGSEGTEQQDKLTGKISARIVECTNTGMFKIQGERLLEVNGVANLMQIEGYVRPRDINTDNTIYSYNLADAKIIYRKNGLGNKVFKPGTIQSVTTWLLGIGLISAAIWGIAR